MPLVDEGMMAPSFDLPDQHGRRHALEAYRGRPVLLYFYPKDDTPGCTREACQFRDLMPRFDERKTVVFGVSPDGTKSHARFIEKYDLNFTLLADEPIPDEGGKDTPPVCAAYGVWQKKAIYGRKYRGVVRTTYLIDETGKVLRRWDRVKVPGHGDAVLEAVPGP